MILKCLHPLYIVAVYSIVFRVIRIDIKTLLFVKCCHKEINVTAVHYPSINFF